MLVNIIKIIIYSVVVGITVFAVGVLTGNNTNAVMGVALFMIAMLSIVVVIETSQKKFTDQQTQIDDLKRELEEMKQKQIEPQS